MEPPSSTTTPLSPRDGDAAPARWLFLTDWFTCLEDHGVSLSHQANRDDIRVGESELEDGEMWLQLFLSHAFLTDAAEEDEHGEFYDVANADPDWATDPHVLQRLGSLREAIILTSLVGKTDYDGWLAMMTQFAGLEIPQQYKQRAPHGHVPRLPIQFEFFLRDEHNLEFLEWSCLGHLLGNINHSANYYRDLERVRRELTECGFVWMEIAPTPVKLEWSIDYFPDREVSWRLFGIGSNILRTQRLDERAQDEGESRGVVLLVTTVDVDLRSVALHNSLVEALTSLLLCGVCVSRLVLPGRLSAPTLRSIRMWCPFVRLLTGVDRDDQGRVASARQIEIPGSYAATLYFALFCSALVYANGVEKLCLLCTARDHSLGEHGAPSRLHAWRWLAFALFSKASRTSVKKFSIRGEVLLPDDVAAIKQVVDSANPFQVLGASSFIFHSGNAPSLLSSTTRPLTTIPRRQELQISSGIHTSACHSTNELTGELLSEPSESGERVLFIPGYGLCCGQLSEISDTQSHNQPATSRATSSVDQFVLGYSERGEHHPSDILALLESIGSQLRGMRLLMDTNDATMRRIFELCPNLESIRIERATLSSMDVFDDAYARGIQLSSLHASEVKVPDVALQDFVRKLAVKNPHKNTAAYFLERLCWHFRQDIPSSDKTLRMFEDVLANNTTLTRLDGLFIRPAGDTNFLLHDQIALNEFDGRRVPGLPHAQKEQLLAFLRGICALSHRNEGLYVNDRVKHLVCEFVFEPRYHRVFWFSFPPRGQP